MSHEITHREACKRYTYGFALACLTAAVLAAGVHMYAPLTPLIERGTEGLYLVWSGVGFLALLFARYRPVMFYNALEPE